jgi:hypothetical protein
MKQEYVSPLLIEDQEVGSDPLSFGADRIRTSEMEGDIRSLYKVEALRGTTVVLSIEYKYQLDGSKERLMIQASGLDADGTESSGVIVVEDGKEVVDELSQNRRLSAGLVWLLGPEGEVKHHHRLVGGAGSFTAGTGMWTTIHSDGQCVPCHSGPWCNCD